MLVSVIIPVYNVEKYLRQCVNSVLNQTYKDLEIILVDDGSTDSSGSICEEYQNEYENIIAVHKKNDGLGMARNTGIDNSTGDYILFIDSDDYIEEDLIQILVDNVNNYELDFCKSAFKKVDNNGIMKFKRVYNDELFIGDAPKNELLPRMIGSSVKVKDSIEMSATACLYKSEYIKKFNIRFPSERVMISEDLVFNIDYMQYSKKAKVVNYCGYNYRVNFSSLTKMYRKNRFELCENYYKEVRKKIVELNYSDEVVLRLSKMFFVHLKMCVVQEKKKVSHLRYRETRENLKKICNSKLVSKVIEDYPVNELCLKKRIFLYLIKFKCISIIYFIINFDII